MKKCDYALWRTDEAKIKFHFGQSVSLIIYSNALALTDYQSLKTTITNQLPIHIEKIHNAVVLSVKKKFQHTGKQFALNKE